MKVSVARRGKSSLDAVRESDCESFYHLKTPDRQAWIELLIDNVAKAYRRFCYVFEYSANS